MRRAAWMVGVVVAAVVAAAVAVGLVWRGGRPRGGPVTVPILMYHHIGEGPGVWWVSPAEFEEHLRQLRAAGYESVRPSELVAAVRRGRRLPEKPLMITFDDGYLSMLTEAEPRLAKYGFHGVVHLITDRVADGPETRMVWDNEPCLTWPEVRAMQARGVISFGGHGRTHANLAKSPDAEREILDSFQAIRRHGGFRPVLFAYPYGAHGERTWRALRKAGYRAAVICDDRVASATGSWDLFHLPRVSMFGGLRRIRGEWLTDEAGWPAGWSAMLEGVSQPVRVRLVGPDGAPLWESERVRLRRGERFEFSWGSELGGLEEPVRLELRDGHGLFVWEEHVFPPTT